MTSLLLQFVFIALLVILPMALYRSRRSFMAVFYRAMTDNAQVRKFYTQVRRLYLSEHPDEMSDIYHCNHHARLP